MNLLTEIGFVISSTRRNRLEYGKFMWTVLKEFLRFCAQEKKWWLVPLVVVLLLLGAILIFSASSGIVWALYPFM